MKTAGTGIRQAGRAAASCAVALALAFSVPTGALAEAAPADGRAKAPCAGEGEIVSLAECTLSLGFYANASSEYTGYYKNLVGTLVSGTGDGAFEIPSSEYDLVIYRDAACEGPEVPKKDFKNAGVYYVRAQAKEGSRYTGQSAPASIEITKKLVTAPERNLNSDGSNLRYNGSEQTGVSSVSAVDAAFYTVEGTEAATLPGTYTATYKLKDPENSQWKNDRTGNPAADREITWTLDKGWLLTVAPKSGSIPIGAANAQEKITFAYHGNGDISAVSSDGGVVKVTEIDQYNPGGTGDDVTHSGKISIEGVATGEAVVTVAVDMDEAYADRYQNRTIEVKVSVDFTEVPTVKVPDAHDYVYDGLSHVGAELTSQYMTLSGILEATDVGTYVVFADLVGNAQWADPDVEGTRAQVIWEITPAYLTDFTLVADNAADLREGADVAPAWSLIAPGTDTQTIKDSDYLVKYYADANGNREISWSEASAHAGTYYARAVAQGANCRSASGLFPVAVLESASPDPGSEAADKAAAAAVDAAIAAIGDVTLESEGAIRHARSAYDALSAAQKSYVQRYADLERAESVLTELIAASAQMPAYIDVGFGAGETPHWVASSGYLKRAFSLGIMQGWKNADGTWSFGPDNAITRGEVATMLWRHACPIDAADYVMNTAKNDTPFVDAPGGTFYTAAVNWAYKSGVMTGYPDAQGNLIARPTDTITREEAATLLARYAKLGGVSASASSAAFESAPDARDVSAWAAPSVAWCFASGIMTGMSDTKKLAPQANATRAELCKMAVELIGLLSDTN